MASSTRPVDAAELKPVRRSRSVERAADSNLCRRNRPVRRMGMIVDDSTLDIPAFKRRGETPALR